jgi:hypothetical protein
MNEKTTSYFLRLIDIMNEYNVSMVEAMDFDFDIEIVDTSSSLAICDYLEEQTGDLVFVEAMIAIWNGQENDYVLIKEAHQ